MNGWQVFVEIAGRPPVELKAGESIIGRSRTAQVQVPDSTVSRQHARLLLGALGEVSVEDLGSSNGTIVNGNRVEGRQKLADGDRILIGDAELRLRIVAPVAPSEATVRMVLPPMTGPAGAPGLAPPAPMPPPVPAPPAMAPPAMAPPPVAPSPLAPPPIALSPMAPPPMAPVPPSAAPSPLSLPLQVAPPPVAPSSLAPPPIAPPPIAPSAPVPRVTMPIPSPSPFATPPVPLEMAEIAPPPIPRPAPPPFAAPPVAPAPARPAPPPLAPPPAAPAISPRTGAARGAELPSVTMIDRIPIPQVTPEVIRAAKLARATPAGFWIRVVAALVDGALVGIVSAAVGAMIYFLPLPQMFRLMMVYTISGALGLAYPLVFWATQGATPGKKMLGLVIVTAATKSTGGGIGWGTAILRALGYFLSSALLGLGYLLVAFTSQKQGLHDLIASTRVVRIR